jgi:hypothetical protein
MPSGPGETSKIGTSTLSASEHDSASLRGLGVRAVSPTATMDNVKTFAFAKPMRQSAVTRLHPKVVMS